MQQRAERQRAPLAKIGLVTSGVVPYQMPEVWRLVRRFGEAGEWLGLATAESCASALLPGQVEGQIGALRLIKYGNRGYVEQLCGLDDSARSMSWRIVSHQLNTNPYPAAFLNYRATIRLAEVTIEGSTFVEWECSFETECPSSDAMRAALRARCESGIRGLGTWLSLHGTPTGPPSWGSSGSPGSPSKKPAPVIGAVGAAGAPAVAISASAYAAAAAAAPQLLAASHAANGALQPGMVLPAQAGLAAMQPGNVPLQRGPQGVYTQAALAPAQPLAASSLAGAAAFSQQQLQPPAVAQAALALHPNPAGCAPHVPLQALAAPGLAAAPDAAQHTGATRGPSARPVSLRRGHTDGAMDSGSVTSPRSTRGVAYAGKMASC